jgi:hypothetical protein
MKPRRSADPLATPAAIQFALRERADRKHSVENAGHFVRLPAVNLNQKGSRHVPANINARQLSSDDPRLSSG